MRGHFEVSRWMVGSMVEMDLAGINWLAVVAVVIMSLVLGFLWYGPFTFGKVWLRLAGLTEEQAKKTQAKAFGGAIAGAFVLALGVAVLVQWTAPADWIEGATIGLLAALFLVAPVIVVDNLFQQRPTGLSLLNSGFHVIEITLAGAILAGWP